MTALPFPSPTTWNDSPSAVLLGYLDYFRSVVVDKLAGMSDEALASSTLPSGWTPLSMLKHLTYVERRWLEWGFEGSPVDDVWGDQRDDRFYAAPEETLSVLVAQLHDRAAITRAIVERHSLDEVGVPGERWDGDPPARLDRVLLHLMQEYARHCGHLDIVRELYDGRTGEGG